MGGRGDKAAEEVPDLLQLLHDGKLTTSQYISGLDKAIGVDVNVSVVRIPVTVYPVVSMDALNNESSIAEVRAHVEEKAGEEFLRQVEKARKMTSAET